MVDINEKNLKDSETSGVVFIDKPYGITSHHTSEIVKKILKVKKAGHTGTLDPKATGLLIVLINKSTRLSSILNLDKTYVGVGKLHRKINKKQLEEITKKFLGKLLQLPPRRSSVKRIKREREVYEFKILEKKGNYFLFRIRCEAGTYVRKLIHDLGKEVSGAHMLELRRIAIGKIKEKNAITLYQLEDLGKNVIMSNEKLTKLLQYKSIMLKKDDATRFCNGCFIKNKKIVAKENEKVLVFCKNFYKRFVGVGITKNGMIKPEIVIAKKDNKKMN